MGTSNYEASLPNILPKQIEAMQAEIAALQEQRRVEGLFLNVKAEEAKVKAAKEEAEAVLRAANEKAQQIVDEATAKAGGIVDAAKAEADSVTGTANKLLMKAYTQAQSTRERESELSQREEALRPNEEAIEAKKGLLANDRAKFNELIDQIYALKA